MVMNLASGMEITLFRMILMSLSLDVEVPTLPD